jgi:glutamate N-acetyltransferase/amino-acid N-acetyltransferase
MTTDKLPKECAVEIEVGEENVKIGGVAKGAGMIRPDMATMLSFVTTDATITHEMLQQALTESVNQSFNRITVDGDMSTNDTVLVLATCNAQNPPIEQEGEFYDRFRDGLGYVCRRLAKMIVEDGEGATKLVTVVVKGASSHGDAERSARAVADSPLVKTALFGMDPNWGRIAAALGYSGAVFDPEKIEVWFDDLQVVKDGIAADYDEKNAKKLLTKNNITITICLNSGESECTIWTCDLTHKYIDINASYRS